MNHELFDSLGDSIVLIESLMIDPSLLLSTTVLLTIRMDKELELDKDLKMEKRGFYDRARQWYFGGYLKMQQVKSPDASELIQLLHALGYVVREIEHPSCGNLKLQQEEFSIEIKSKSPPFRVVMNSPITTSFAPGKYFSGNVKESEIDLKPVLDPLNLPNMPILRNVPEKKQIVAREIVQILIQYIADKKESTLARPSYKFNREQRRKCMSMESINLARPQGIKLTKTNDGNVLAIEKDSEVTVRGIKTGVTMIPLVVNVPSTATEYQAEAMEVNGDILPSLASNVDNSIFRSNLSPIEFSPSKEKWWVIETSKEKVLDTSSLPKSSTPNPELLKNYRLNKIQCPKQMCSVHSPDRLRSTKKQDVHPISQTKGARKIALMNSKKVMNPQTQPQSKNSKSSSSSKSTFMATRTQPSHLPQSIIHPQAKKQRENCMNTKDKERAARQNRLELPTYSTRYGLRSKRP